MEIEKLIKHMREEAQDYRSGRTLGRAFADAEDVLDEAATALERLQAENDRLKEEVQQMRWIPVEERLPEPNTGDGYWVAKKGPRGNTMMKLAQYSDYGMAMSIDAVTDITWRDWDFTNITDVTHWMPLPKAPKEDNL